MEQKKEGKGNRRPNNWNDRKNEFLKQYLETGEAAAANELGSISYYGRANHGVPQYEDAFRYFSIGHAIGSLESTCRLGEMFSSGYGVAKDGKTAKRLFEIVYHESIRDFMRKDFGCPFAEAAFRLGNCYRYGIGTEKNPETAYRYYLQAHLAIRKRLETVSDYDTITFERVLKKDMEAVRQEYTLRGRSRITASPDWLEWTTIDHRRCRMRIHELQNGVLGIDFTPLPYYDEKTAPMMLVTLPKADFSELRKKIRIRTAPNSKYLSVNGGTDMVFDHCEYDPNRNIMKLFLNETYVGAIVTRFYSFKANPPRKAAKAQKKVQNSGVKTA